MTVASERRLSPVPLLLGAVLVLFLVLPVLAVLLRGLGADFWPTLHSRAVQDALRVSLLTTGDRKSVV